MSGRIVRLLAAASVAGAAHAALNTALLRRPPAAPPPVDRPVTVVLPVRDEVGQVGACLAAVLDQRGVPGLRVVVVDDGSTDGTREAVLAFADDRVTLVEAGAPPPGGWASRTPARSAPPGRTTASSSSSTPTCGCGRTRSPPPWPCSTRTTSTWSPRGRGR